MTGEWWCEAYGPPDAGVSAEAWPRCFRSAEVGERVCSTAEVCSVEMAGERRRVFDRLQQLAAEGDEIGMMLAADFTSPDELLGGAATSSET